MAINEFFVTSRVDKWYVDNGVDSHGPYLSQQDAVADAIQAAEQTASNRKATAVLLKLPGSNATVIWNSRQAMRDLESVRLNASA
jgi:hypothetical protein